jgi:hypothetical protein
VENILVTDMNRFKQYALAQQQQKAGSTVQVGSSTARQ